MLLFGTVWSKKQVPVEWHDATLVPIPKKRVICLFVIIGGLKLLDVMAKLFARMLNNRLQTVVEGSVADSQCYKRLYRYVFFVFFKLWRRLLNIVAKFLSDHRKAYDSVPKITCLLLELILQLMT